MFSTYILKTYRPLKIATLFKLTKADIMVIQKWLQADFGVMKT